MELEKKLFHFEAIPVHYPFRVAQTDAKDRRKCLFNDDTAKTVIGALVSVIPFASEGQNADQLGGGVRRTEGRYFTLDITVACSVTPH